MQDFDADYEGVKPAAGRGDLMPIKDEATDKRIRYLGQIEAVKPYMSTNGNPSVGYEIKVVGGRFNGRVLKFQSVTFLPKDHNYAGLTLHFLKTLRVPFEGKFKVQPETWVGRYVYFFIRHEESTKTNAEGEPYVNEKVNATEVVDIPTLIDLGEYASAADAPAWLQEAQRAFDAASGTKAPAQAAAGKDSTSTATATKPKAEASVRDDKPQPAPTAICEKCERKYKDHKGLKHEFDERIPF